MSKSLIILLVVFSVMLFSVSFYSLLKLDPNPKPFAVRNIIPSTKNTHIGGKFALDSTLGRTFTEQDLLGKISIIYFGFTYCPDICPTSLLKISAALNDLDPKQLEQIQTLFITVDPERDTVNNLKLYLNNYKPQIIGLTGTLTEVKKAADAYQVYFSKSHQDHKEYTIDHTSFVYLMDRNGKLIVYFTLKSKDMDIKQELMKHLK